MSRKLTIAVDVDEVCADLLTEWLNRYNLKYKDTLLSEDITAWNIRPFVKPEARQDIYHILHEEDLYEAINPLPYARTAVNQLRAMGHRVIFVTSCVKGTADAKQDWLLRWQFLPKPRKDEDFCAVTDKSLIRADYLFDDRIDNVAGFRGRGVLVTRRHNEHESHPYRVESLRQAPYFVELMERCDYSSLVPAKAELLSRGMACG